MAAQLGRRSFLKILGGVGAAIAASPLLVAPSAPLYIPAERLEFGTPNSFVTVASLEQGDVQALIAQTQAHQALMIDEDAQHRMAMTVPMLMLRDEYHKQLGGRLYSGSTVLMDAGTAKRWADIGIAVPQNRGLHRG